MASTTYYLYPDTAGEWRWRLKSSNGRIIATSGEGYHNKADARSAIDLVKGSANASVVED